jgi:V/A-type H+-transporting ATPase subunit K
MAFELISAAILTLCLIAPLFLIYRKYVQGKKVKSRLIMQIVAFFGLGVIMVSMNMSHVFAEAATTGELTAGLTDKAFGFIAAALSTGLSGIGGGIAVSSSAAAALGAISENANAFGKALIFVGLAEGIALYGMIISFMIIGQF